MELVEKVRAVANVFLMPCIESNWWDKQSGVEYPPVCVVQRCDSGSTDHHYIIGRRRLDTYTAKVVCVYNDKVRWDGPMTLYPKFSGYKYLHHITGTTMILPVIWCGSKCSFLDCERIKRRYGE